MRHRDRNYRNHSGAVWPLPSARHLEPTHLVLPAAAVVPIVRPVVSPLVIPELVLAPRQKEVLLLISQGFTTRQIARRLGISVKTVEAHRSLLMQRLDIHETAGLTRYAIRSGFVVA